MITEILTRADLLKFKEELIEELKPMFSLTPPRKKFLRAVDVKKMLACSEGSIYNYRLQGILNPVKIGGTWFFEEEEISKLFNSGNKSINSTSNTSKI